MYLRDGQYALYIQKTRSLGFNLILIYPHAHDSRDSNSCFRASILLTKFQYPYGSHFVRILVRGETMIVISVYNHKGVRVIHDRKQAWIHSDSKCTTNAKIEVFTTLPGALVIEVSIALINTQWHIRYYIA